MRDSRRALAVGVGLGALLSLALVTSTAGLSVADDSRRLAMAAIATLATALASAVALVWAAHLEGRRVRREDAP